MVIATATYRVRFDSEEECILRQAIRENVTKKGASVLFDDLWTDGETCLYLRIYKETKNRSYVNLTLGEIYYVVEMLKKAYKKHQIPSLKEMIDTLSDYSY